MDNKQTHTGRTAIAGPLPPRIKLVRGIDFYEYLLRVNPDNWNRMRRVLKWGEAARFINDAIREKLDRDHPEPIKRKQEK